MRTIRLTSILFAASAVLAACGAASSTDQAPAPDPSASSASEPNDSALSGTGPDGSSIPDGTWAKTSTTADAKQLGIPPRIYGPFIGADGELHVELRIEGDDWAQFGDDGDLDDLVQGDSGTAGYDSEGNWVATSTSAGCPGCVMTMQWSLDGDRLTLSLLDTSTSDGPMGVLLSRLVMEGTYTRSS